VVVEVVEVLAPAAPFATKSVLKPVQGISTRWALVINALISITASNNAVAFHHWKDSFT
jgi:hypothetical protein